MDVQLTEVGRESALLLRRDRLAAKKQDLMLDHQFAETVDGFLRQFLGELDALDDGAEGGSKSRNGDGHGGRNGRRKQNSARVGLLPPAAQTKGSTSRLLIQLLYLVYWEKPNSGEGIPQPHRVFVPSQHRRKQFAVIFRLRNGVPFVIGRNPRPLIFPWMQICEHLGSNFPRRKASHHCKSNATLLFIQFLMRKTTSSRRPNAARREFQLIALANAPLVQDTLGQNHS